MTDDTADPAMSKEQAVKPQSPSSIDGTSAAPLLASGDVAVAASTEPVLDAEEDRNSAQTQHPAENLGQQCPRGGEPLVGVTEEAACLPVLARGHVIAQSSTSTVPILTAQEDRISTQYPLENLGQKRPCSDEPLEGVTEEVACLLHGPKPDAAESIDDNGSASAMGFMQASSWDGIGVSRTLQDGMDVGRGVQPVLAVERDCGMPHQDMSFPARSEDQPANAAEDEPKHMSVDSVMSDLCRVSINHADLGAGKQLESQIANAEKSTGEPGKGFESASNGIREYVPPMSILNMKDVNMLTESGTSSSETDESSSSDEEEEEEDEEEEEEEEEEQERKGDGKKGKIKVMDGAVKTETESSSSSPSSSSSDEDEAAMVEDEGNQKMDEESEYEEGELKESPSQVGSKRHDSLADFESSDDKDPVRSKNELKDLPHVPEISVSLEPHHKTIPIGVILSSLGTSLVVEGIEGQPPLDEGSILWLTENRSPLGFIDEIFGPVKKPFYLVRYNDASEIPEAAKEGASVAYVLEFAGFVLNNKPDLYKKGYDASGENDEELSDDEIEFSDDEKEAEYKRSRAKNKRQNSTKNPQYTDKLPQGLDNWENGTARGQSKKSNTPNKMQPADRPVQDFANRVPRNHNAHKQHNQKNKKSRFQRGSRFEQEKSPIVHQEQEFAERSSVHRESAPHQSSGSWKVRPPRQMGGAMSGSQVSTYEPALDRTLEHQPQIRQDAPSQQFLAPSNSVIQVPPVFGMPVANQPPFPSVAPGRLDFMQHTAQPSFNQAPTFQQAHVQQFSQTELSGQATRVSSSVQVPIGIQNHSLLNANSFHMGIQATGLPAPVLGIPAACINHGVNSSAMNTPAVGSPSTWGSPAWGEPLPFQNYQPEPIHGGQQRTIQDQSQQMNQRRPTYQNQRSPHQGGQRPAHQGQRFW